MSGGCRCHTHTPAHAAPPPWPRVTRGLASHAVLNQGPRGISSPEFSFPLSSVSTAQKPPEARGGQARGCQLARSPCQGAPRGSILAGSAREGFLRCGAGGPRLPVGGMTLHVLCCLRLGTPGPDLRAEKNAFLAETLTKPSSPRCSIISNPQSLSSAVGR